MVKQVEMVLPRVIRPVADAGSLIEDLRKTREGRINCSKPKSKIITLLGVSEQITAMRRKQVQRPASCPGLEEAIREALGQSALMPIDDVTVAGTEHRRITRGRNDVISMWVCNVESDVLETERAVIREVIERSVGCSLPWSENKIGFYLGTMDNYLFGKDVDKYDNLLPQVIKLEPAVISSAAVKVSPRLVADTSS